MNGNPGKQLQGQLYKTDKDITIPYTQQEMPDESANLLVGNARTEITPTDRGSSEVKVFGDPTNDILQINRRFYSTTNLNGVMPPVLHGIEVTFSKTKGEGLYTEDAWGSSGGSDSASLSFNLNGSAQSSASIVMDIVPDIRPTFATNVPTVNLLFYHDGSDELTFAIIQQRIYGISGLTVNQWPKFRPRPEIIVIKNKQTSIRVDTRLSQSTSYTEGNSTIQQTKGRGFSLELGNNTRTITIPESIHGTVNITYNLLDAIETVKATSACVIVGGIGFPDATEALTKEADPLVATIFPVVLPPTPYVTAIPTSGYYLWDVNTNEDEYGLLRVHVAIIDFSYFA